MNEQYHSVYCPDPCAGWVQVSQVSPQGKAGLLPACLAANRTDDVVQDIFDFFVLPVCR